MMSPEAKQRIQLALVAAMVIAGLRAGYILYQRHEDQLEAEKQAQAKNVGYSNPDYYVAPKKTLSLRLEDGPAAHQNASVGEGGISLHLLFL